MKVHPMRHVEVARRILIVAAAAIFAAALIHRFHALGGPYFEFPSTIQDHVAKVRYASVDAILLTKRAATMLPRGATVTVLQPSLAPNYDNTHFLTAVGLMPHHQVVSTDPANGPQYVLALREPYTDARYELVGEFAEGRIYKRR